MLLKMEEHATVIRALLQDESANTSLSIGTFQKHGLMLPNGYLNRPKIIALLKRSGANGLRNLEGMGHGSFLMLMRMMLEDR